MALKSSPSSHGAKRWACFGTILLMLVYLCRHVIGGITQAWQAEEYSYAWFLPPIALMLCLHSLSRARPLPAPSWTGFAVIVLGFLPYLAGVLSGIPNMPQYGLLIFIYGIALVFFGAAVFKNIRLPMSYLFFALPLPQAFYLILSAHMQLLSSSIGTEILQLLNIPAFQDGNIIDLGDYKLQVVEACSGLRYLFPLMGFSFLFAYLLRDKTWKRLVVFVSAIPIAVALNVFRIAVIGITVHFWGVRMAEGLLHDFEGWVAFGFCIVLLFAEATILGRIGARGHLSLEDLTLPHGPYLGGPVRLNAPVFAVFILFAVAIAGETSGLIAPRPETPPYHRAFIEFPLAIDDWHGQSNALPTETVDLLKATDYLDIDYRAAQNAPDVDLFMVYYASQRDERTFHSPQLCMPGSGWEEISSQDYAVPIARPEHPLHVHRVLISKGDARQIVYYWFEQRGKNLTGLYSVKAQIIKDSLMMGRTDGTLVRLVTPIAAGETEQDADYRLQKFLTDADRQMRAFLPDLSYALKAGAAP